MKGGQFCFWHDPERTQERLEASARGGARRTVELPEADLLTPERARAILAGVIEAVGTGTLASATARTVGYLIQIESRIREGYDLERRVAAIEELMTENE